MNRTGKRILLNLSPILSASLLLATPMQAAAQTTTATQATTQSATSQLSQTPPSTIRVVMDQEPLPLQHPPVITNGSALVPLRSIFEALGTQVHWDNGTQTVTATKDDTTIQLTIGQTVAYKNQQPINLASPGVLIDGFTMVPLRFVAESLGATVNWDGVTETVSIVSPPPPTGAGTPIQGNSVKTPDELYAFASKVNPKFPKELANLYIQIGKVYHIRGDIAFMQMCLETGFYRFGGTVTPDQNNVAGIGVTEEPGSGKGNQFPNLHDGVEVQIQHLYAYATQAQLPEEATLLDPRFKYVERGSAPTWEQLDGKWATSPQYGEEIVSLYQKMNHHLG